MADTSIAILPFQYIGSNQERAYLSDGITEELIQIFSKLDGVRVASRTSSFYFKDKILPLEEIRRQLNVQYILEGSVREGKDRVRVSVNLTNLNTGLLLWNETFDRSSIDIFALQLEIAETIRSKYLQKSGFITAPHSTKVPNNDVKAYRAFLQGRYYFNRYTMENFRKAIGYYQQAIDLQPNFAQAHAGLAICYFGLGGFIDKRYHPMGRKAVLKALSIDPNCLDALISLAFIQIAHDWDWPGAKQTIKQALEINYDSPDVHRLYGIYYMTIGNLEKAIYEKELALRFDPLNTIYIRSLAWTCAYDGQYVKATKECERALELDPTFRPAIELMGWIHIYQKQYGQALKYFKKYQSMVGHPLKGWSGIGYTYAITGETEKAYAVLDIFAQREQELKDTIFLDYAIVFLGLGQYDKAITYLEKSLAEKFILSACTVSSDPIFDPIRSYPKFKRLFKVLGLQESKLSANESLPETLNKVVTIHSKTKEKLSFLVSDLIAVIAEGNYAKFIWKEGNQVYSKMLRITLAEVLIKLKQPSIFQTHRSYVVNLCHFELAGFSSKKQEIQSKWLKEPVPVSRKNVSIIKEWFKKNFI